MMCVNYREIKYLDTMVRECEVDYLVTARLEGLDGGSSKSVVNKILDN